MLSVAGLDKAKVQSLCSQAIKKEGPTAVCQIANELFPKGFSVGGTKKAIEALKEMAEKEGALQAMLPRMNSPMHTVWMNASAEPARPGCEPRKIVDLLQRQLTNPVLWEPSMTKLIK